MLNDGERQVAPTLAGIRRDHVARYEWAAKKLKGREVIDLACGIGYGSKLLADAGCEVLGVDRDAGALQYARRHYAHEYVRYYRRNAAKMGVWTKRDAAVCFETIEHIKDPRGLLKALRASAPLLLASVPNEDEFPWRNYAFHYRHYTRLQFEYLLEECGWRVEEWWGQKGPESEVELGAKGRTLIAVARHCRPITAKRVLERRAREVAIKPAPSLKVARPDHVPEHVAIVGLGPSRAQLFELACGLGGMSAECDEVWGINAIGDVLRCDRVFHMDDVRIQEARAVEKPDGNIAAMVQWLKSHPGPIYTSVVRDGYPGMVAYPLQDVLNGCVGSSGGVPYFNSTVAYALAYARHIGVKKISCYGMDFTLQNRHSAEKGRACVEFWLGMCMAGGIEIELPGTTSLMDSCEGERHPWFYGYDCVDVTLQPGDRGVEVIMKERAVIPTAAEIEARYDPAKHPNPLVKESK